LRRLERGFHIVHCPQSSLVSGGKLENHSAASSTASSAIEVTTYLSGPIKISYRVPNHAGARASPVGPTGEVVQHSLLTDGV